MCLENEAITHFTEVGELSGFAQVAITENIRLKERPGAKIFRGPGSCKNNDFVVVL